jgi:hypothetical protein
VAKSQRWEAEYHQIKFVSFRPLGAEARRWLTEDLGRPLPKDVDIFYDHCDPWGPFVPERAKWHHLQRFLLQQTKTKGLLLPIDIGSTQGWYVVAAPGTADCSEVYALSTRRQWMQHFPGGVREYLVWSVEDEAEASGESDNTDNR